MQEFKQQSFKEKTMKQFVTEIWYGEQVDIKLSYENIPEVATLKEREELVQFEKGCKRVRYWINVANDGPKNTLNSYERKQLNKKNRLEAKRQKEASEAKARYDRIMQYRENFEKFGKVFLG
jgi:hypothetical protein